MQYLKLDIGCGGNKKPGTLGLDYVQQPGVDYVIDLQTEKLPFASRSVEYIHSSHFLEHLSPNTVIPLFCEISRVCIDRAQLEFWTPYLWTNSAFVFGHTSYWNEDHYMHLCVWFGDFWGQALGARWLLKEFVYVVDPRTLIELYRNKIQIDFALKHYQGIVSEFAVIIEIRHDYQEPSVYPKRTFTTNRFAQRYQLPAYSEVTDENELLQAINWFSSPS